jgi:hypothetical protein
LVETENGSFPLIIDNLNNTALYWANEKCFGGREEVIKVLASNT